MTNVSMKRTQAQQILGREKKCESEKEICEKSVKNSRDEDEEEKNRAFQKWMIFVFVPETVSTDF